MTLMNWYKPLQPAHFLEMDEIGGHAASVPRQRRRPPAVPRPVDAAAELQCAPSVPGPRARPGSRRPDPFAARQS